MRNAPVRQRDFQRDLVCVFVCERKRVHAYLPYLCAMLLCESEIFNEIQCVRLCVREKKSERVSSLSMSDAPMQE